MTRQPIAALSRRQLFAGLSLALVPGQLLADPADQPLRFAVFRNGSHIGEHEMSFVRAGERITAATSVAFVIRLGPAPVFRYSHQASETWRADRFERLDTSTISNGKREHVAARSQAGAVVIETQAGSTRGPAAAAPLTHWNPQAFNVPLFNPQTGRALKVSVQQFPGDRPPGGGSSAMRWSIRGESEIDDWYDEGGAWSALRGRLPDRSLLEYRRV